MYILCLSVYAFVYFRNIKIGEKNFWKIGIFFENAPIRKEKFENDLKWPTFRATVKS